VRELELYKKYLPAGSTVAFDIGTKGGVVLVDAVLSGRHAISYLGTAPTVEALRESAKADIRVVASGAVSQDQCGLVLARAGVEIPAGFDASLAWLDGKRLGVPYHTCAELFLQRVLARSGGSVRPIDQSIDVLAASLASATVDAVSVWEPTASELVARGLAVPLLSGTEFGFVGGAFVVMRQDLIAARPDVVLAWLHAEFDAQALLADPAARESVVALLAAQARAVSADAIRSTLDRRYPTGEVRARMRYPFVPDAESLNMLTTAAATSASARRSSEWALRPEAIEPRYAEAVARQMGSPAHRAAVTQPPR
jgi:NitT/TauT family transport system substrate-binding protein